MSFFQNPLDERLLETRLDDATINLIKLKTEEQKAYISDLTLNEASEILHKMGQETLRFAEINERMKSLKYAIKNSLS